MRRTDIINSLIYRFGYKSYLEIGVQFPKSNFDNIIAEHKVSVDPAPEGLCTFIGTSDAYFDSISSDTSFDIIFIDGLHEHEQVLKDIDNSLKHLSPNGTIVCHDCLPTSEHMQLRDDHGKEWTGDVWKAIAILRTTVDDLYIKVIDTDYGCGIIRRGTNSRYTPTGNYLTYEYYAQHRQKMLNMTSTDDFVQWINTQ
jgi:hypothetical protein